MKRDHRAVTSADRVCADWQPPTTTALLLFLLSLLLQLLLGFTHFLQLLFDC